MLASCLLVAAPALQSMTAGLSRLDALEGHASAEFEPFSFVQIGDPQIGYGSTWPAARRLKRLAHELEGVHAAFGLVVGDMVQDGTWLEKKLLRRALQEFSLPLAFVPGERVPIDLGG